MLRAFRFIIELFTQRHGIIAFVFFLVLSLLMRQAPNAVRESIVSTALGTVFYPAQFVVSAVTNYKSIVEENDQLKKENARLKQESYHSREALQELARLHTLVRFDDKWDYPIVTARVVGHNPGRFLTTMVINRGAEHGLKVNMPVLCMNGLVGKISKVSVKHSTVQMLQDPNFTLSIMSDRSRTVGLLESMDGRNLTAVMPTHGGVKKGDTLITSGLGGIFPKGIPVGIVGESKKSDLEVMKEMSVSLFQELSDLEEVFVMEKEPDWIVKELLDE